MAIFAQNSNVIRLTESAERKSKTARGWIALDSGWKYKTGDSPNWALPGFNDSAWQTIHLFENEDSLTSIVENGITWFRLKIKNDSTFPSPLIMRIYQSGASEIYLDGKLIHQ